MELKDLQATLKNIETARPFDELTVVRAMFFSVDVEKEEEEEEEGEKMDEGDDEDEVTDQMRCDGRRDGTRRDENTILIQTLQDEVAAAEPSIDEKTAKLVEKGRWTVPGYKVRTNIHTLFPPSVLFSHTPANSGCFPHLTGKIRRPCRRIDDAGFFPSSIHRVVASAWPPYGWIIPDLPNIPET